MRKRIPHPHCSITRALALVWIMSLLAGTAASAEATALPGVQASVYYVATDGSDGNAGTQAQPFLTISKAAAVVQPGDTVYVHGGVYHERVRLATSGDTTHPISLLAYPGESPVIDGLNNLPATWSGLLDVSGDYVVADGFEIRNSAYVGVRVAGRFDKVSHLYVHHSQENGVYVAGANNLVESSDIWWNSAQAANGGVTHWSAGLSAARHPTNTTIRNNVIHQNWGEGLSTYEADHTTLENNVVYDNWGTNLYVSDATDVIVQRNLVYAVPGSVVDQAGKHPTCIGLADETGVPDSRRITIINNVALNCYSNLYWWADMAGSGLKDSLIAHNTLVDARGANLRIAAGNHINTRIQNNIISSSSGSITSVVANSALYFSHNLWTQAPGAGASGPNDLVTNPQFVNTSAGDFHLRPTSPAVDSSIALSAVADDKDGVSRPRGLGYDRGAYENWLRIDARRIFLPMLVSSP